MPDFTKASERVIAAIRSILGVSMVIDRDSHPERLHYRIQIRDLLRAYDGEAHIYIVDTSSSVPDPGSYYRSADSLTIVFHMGAAVDYVSTNRLIYLGEEGMRSLSDIANLPSPERLTSFRQLLFASRSPKSFNPYQSSVPATGRMFFDRVGEVSSLASTARWKCIVGPRRVGKTSVANALHAHLAVDPLRSIKLEDEIGSIVPLAFVDCLTKDEDTLWEALYDQIGITSKDRAEGRRHALTDPIKRRYRRLSAFESFYKLTSDIYHHPYVILDEIDKLIRLDKASGWPFFGRLRGWAADTQGGLLLVGYMDLYAALNDSTFPLYQMCDILILQNLPFDAAKALVEQPSSELGVTFSPDAIDLLVAATGGAPSRIQELCSRLLAAQKPSKLIDTSDVVREVTDDQNLETLFYSITQESSRLARAILFIILGEIVRRNSVVLTPPPDIAGRSLYEHYLLAASSVIGKISINAGNIKEALLAHVGADREPIDIDVLFNKALDELELRGVISSAVRFIEYRFASSAILSRFLQDFHAGGIDTAAARALKAIGGV